jgi:hypothetical protein
MDMSHLLWWLLGAVVFPAWLLSGCADYACHARTDIAHTSGRHESALHLLQTAEIGLPLLVFLFCEVDALVLAILLAGVVAHTVTSWADLRWATPRREITPGEQYVHSFLNVLPWVALALVVVLHWPVAAALFDPATASDWSLRLRRPMFPPTLLAAVLASSLLLGLLPGAWEYMRTTAAARHSSSSSARSPTKPR